MKERRSRLGAHLTPCSAAVRALLYAGLLAFQGCTLEPSIPATADVRVDVPASDRGTVVWLVTSTEFQSDPDAENPVHLVRADTAQVTLPFEDEVDIGSHAGQRKLYVEVRGIERRSVSTRLRITIQNQSWYDRTLDLSEWFHRFSYVRRGG